MALQIRRGTNQERLGITLVEGEIAYVTDFELATIEVTSINVTTNTLTTTLNHGLSVNDQIKFIGHTANGLSAGVVYWVKTVPDANNFTLSATQGSATFDITGTTGTVSLTFATGPTDALGTPYGYTISPIYVGDGVTAGGNPAGASILDDLYDVSIGVYGNVGQYGKDLNQGQLITYNEESGQWENNNQITATAVGEVIDLIRTTTDATDSSTTLRSSLFLTKEITDLADPANQGGPALSFISRGTNSANDKTMIQIGAYNNSSGIHDFVIKTSTDNFVTDATERFKINKSGANIYAETTATNQPTAPLILRNTSSGTVANGFGTTLSFEAETVTGGIKTIGYMDFIYDDVTNGSEDSRWRVGLLSAGVQPSASATGPGIEVDSSGNLYLDGNITVSGNNIKSSSATALTLSGADVDVKGNLTVTGNNIKSSSDTALTLSGANATVRGTLTVNGTSYLQDFTATGATIGNIYIAASTNNNTISTTTGDLDLYAASGQNILVGNNLLATKDVTITGNLTVNGTTTNLDTVNLVIEDNMIVLNKNETGVGVTAATGTAGIEIERGSLTNVQWAWNETNKWWEPLGDFANQTVWATNGIIGGTYIATNGNKIFFNNEDGVDADCDIQVKRGVAQTYDSYLRWNAGTSRWTFSNGANTFHNMVIGIDDLEDVVITGTPAKGEFLYNNGTNWVNGPRIEFDSTTNRLQLVNNVSGGNSALELLKRGGSTIASGEAVGQLFGAITTGNTKTQMHRLWSVYDGAGAHTFKIQNDSTNSFGSGSTTILDSLSINKLQSYLQSDVQTFNSGSGNTTYMTLNGSYSQILTDFIIGDATSDNLTVNSLVNGDITFKNTDAWTGIKGTNGNNDTWKIGGYATGDNAGELIIATADDNSEPIRFRQYQGNFTSPSYYHETTLMDASGNATFYNNVRANGSLTTGSDLYVEGTNVYLNADKLTGTPTENVAITVRRGGSTNATLIWNEGSDLWETNYSLYSNDALIGNTYIGTNGNDIYLNNDNGAAADARITVKRPSGGNAQILWNEATDRWQTTVDSSTYLNIPNQALDTTDLPTFGGINIDGRSSFDTGATTTYSTATFTLDETPRNAIKCMVYISNGTDSHALEILIMRTAAGAMMTTYGEMYTTAALATFTADQSGSNIRIRCTPASATSTTFSVVRYSLT